MGRHQIDLKPAAADAARILGQQIRFARRDKHWTAAELAAKCGVTAQTVTAIEAGRPAVSFGHVLNCAVTAGVPLFQESDPQELARIRRTGEEKLALIPKLVRHPKESDDGLDF